MKEDKEQEVAARLSIRSYLYSKGVGIKYYIAPFITATVAIAMTVFQSPHAYNLARFASPLLLVVIWAAHILAIFNDIKVSKEKGLSKRFIIIFYSFLVVLLAAFGHPWLALCWIFIWLAAHFSHLLREERCKEKGIEI